jgi:P27 family predicted phage terminase small subunit
VASHEGDDVPGVKGRSGGHNAKTVKEHKLQGTFQKVRHAGVRNPDPPIGIPTPPKKIEGDAAEDWVRMVGRLTKSKTMSEVDDAALYQYCQMFSETERLSISQQEVGSSLQIINDSLGDYEGAERIAIFQEMSKMRQLEAGYSTKIRQNRMALKSWLVEFGLTPASRGRVKLPDAKPDVDEFDEFDGTVN